jgi:hypothetical protein
MLHLIQPSTSYDRIETREAWQVKNFLGGTRCLHITQTYTKMRSEESL